MRACLALALVSFAACASAPPEKPTLTPRILRRALYWAPQAAPPPRAMPYDKPPDDPRAVEVLTRGFATEPVPIDQGAAPELTKAALEDTARSEARGLDRVDAIHVAELDETRRAVLSLEVGRGDCLTVIAHGGLGVMEIDAFLAEHGKAPPSILAQDSRAGPIAVIGGLRGCYPFLDPQPAKVDVIVQARKGSGPVVFAVYRAKA